MHKQKNKPVVAQLTKAPIAGQVKTRMQPYLNDDQALMLHKNMTEHIMSNLTNDERWHHVLWVSEVHAYFSILAQKHSLDVRIQQGVGFGEKLLAISQQHFCHNKSDGEKSKTTPLILIGSDCPTLTSMHINKVLDALMTSDVSVIPATDGGYVALAVKEHYPQLFQSIDWGTGHVFNQTLERANGLRVHVFDAMSDVDRPEDLEQIKGLGDNILRGVTV